MNLFVVMCFCCCSREKLFCQSLAKLKEDVVKANTLVREANFLVQEMAKPIEFSVTLQIPASNLSPNRRVTMLAFMHPPLLVGAGDSMFSCNFSVRPCVRLWCCFCSTCSMHWWIFARNLVINASWDKGELVRFYVQKVKGHRSRSNVCNVHGLGGLQAGQGRT